MTGKSFEWLFILFKGNYTVAILNRFKFNLTEVPLVQVLFHWNNINYC